MMRYVPLEGYQHKCPECGKEFWAMADWAYKAGYANRPVYVCSWKCLQKRRKNGKKGGRKMPDRENVIKALDLCSNALYCADPSSRCDQCPYRTKDMTGTDEMNCSDVLMGDALILLKEQEAVAPVRDEQTGRIWLCGKCGSYVGFEDNDPHDINGFDKYCSECGRPVLWEGR